MIPVTTLRKANFKKTECAEARLIIITDHVSECVTLTKTLIAQQQWEEIYAIMK